MRGGEEGGRAIVQRTPAKEGGTRGGRAGKVPPFSLAPIERALIRDTLEGCRLEWGEGEGEGTKSRRPCSPTSRCLAFLRNLFQHA